MRSNLKNIYNKLFDSFGSQRWWPANSPFEVMLGAILTQNTAWSNVEKAIKNLKRQNLLSPGRIKKVPLGKLKSAIRPSGFYNEKARKLKSFVNFYIKHKNKLAGYKTDALRSTLLDIKGIGPETADSILLYALNRPVFVIDAYTRRILERHKFIKSGISYGEVQDFFMRNLPKKKQLFNEYHALIVKVAKDYCKKKKPFCKICPLSVFK